MDSNKPIEVTAQDLVSTESIEKATITDVQHLASYNWIEASTPTIAVPGVPARWLDIKIPKRLQKDSGLVYIAQNAARHPKCPLEPLFRAVQIESPTFNTCDVDIVSDRNNIRKLLSFVDATTSNHSVEDFTILAELMGDTVVLWRTEAKVQEVIGPNDFRGYGHNFETAYTRPEMAGGTGHHRIITYKFSGLQYVIRHETDGYVRDDSDDILDRLTGLSISSPSSKDDEVTSYGLKLVRGGRVVPIKSTLEIKTRVSHKPLHIDDVAPQLWISQTPLLVRALHTGGRFATPAVENVSTEVAAWEQRHQSSLHKLARLMSKIIGAVRQFRHAKIQYRVSRRTLTIQQYNADDFLPEDLYAYWLAKRPPGGLSTEGKTPSSPPQTDDDNGSKDKVTTPDFSDSTSSDGSD